MAMTPSKCRYRDACSMAGASRSLSSLAHSHFFGSGLKEGQVGVSSAEYICLSTICIPTRTGSGSGALVGPPPRVPGSRGHVRGPPARATPDYRAHGSVPQVSWHATKERVRGGHRTTRRVSPCCTMMRLRFALVIALAAADCPPTAAPVAGSTFAADDTYRRLTATAGCLTASPSPGPGESGGESPTSDCTWERGNGRGRRTTSFGSGSGRDRRQA